MSHFRIRLFFGPGFASIKLFGLFASGFDARDAASARYPHAVAVSAINLDRKP
jgi:hypothetical protein